MSKLLRHRKPVWYNTKTHNHYTSKPTKAINKYCIYFPSTAEYELYITLKSILPNTIALDTQKYLVVGGVRWRIDFRLSTVSPQGMLCLKHLQEAVNGNICKPKVAPSHLFLEYKGTQDQNFRYKQRNLLRYPSIDASLVLVGAKEEVFKCGGLYSKRICSVESLKETLSECQHD